MKQARSLVLVGATALAFAGCGSGSHPSSAANAQGSAISAVVGSPVDSPAPAGATSAARPQASPVAHDPGTVDVCALLSPTDASSVAHADMLSSGQSAATAYAFTAEKVDTLDPTSSECQVSIRGSGGGGGTVDFDVRAGTFIGEYVLDPKVKGLGDEAYDDGSSPAMRVGDLLVTAERNTLPDHLTLDLLRKMAPHLR